MTSPGSSRSTPYSSTVFRTESAIVPVNRTMLALIAGVAQPTAGGPAIVAAKS
jgi:hypothetical protein